MAVNCMNKNVYIGHVKAGEIHRLFLLYIFIYLDNIIHILCDYIYTSVFTVTIWVTVKPIARISSWIWQGAVTIAAKLGMAKRIALTKVNRPSRGRFRERQRQWLLVVASHINLAGCLHPTSATATRQSCERASTHVALY